MTSAKILVDDRKPSTEGRQEFMQLVMPHYRAR
jgi:hypothetical protein